MKPHFLVNCLFSILFVSSYGFAQKTAELERIMKTYHRYNMFDGSVLVAENGKVIYKGAFGMANREWNIPNTTDTKFMIGSVSKPLTAMLVLAQVQKGLIDLDKTISDYLPGFSKKNGSRITVRQLLSHSSGLPNYDIIKDFFPRISRQNFTREEYMKVYMDSTLVFEPGSSYYYSSWGYFTLGCILEKVTGKTYAELMKTDVLDKLAMKNTGSYYHMQIVPKRASGYDYSLNGYTSADFRDQSNTMGTGDLYSTVDDLFRLHIGISSHQVLNEKLTREMFTPGIRPWRYGYGWFNQQFRYTSADSVFTNYHLGMTDGFISFLIRIPSTNSLIVFLCNSSPTHFFGIATNLMKALYNKKVILKEPVHKVMETLIAREGINASLIEYGKMKADTAKYYIDWLAMDQLGTQLVTLKRYDDARLLLENNVNEFPQRDIVLLNLANLYSLIGRSDDAKKYYFRTLEVNGKNEEARNRLKELEQKK